MAAYLMLIPGIIFLGLFLFNRDKNSSVFAVFLKTATSLCFTATAIAALLSRPYDITKDLALTAGLIILGLITGMVGDIFLDLKPYFKSLKDKYAGAMRDHDLATYSGMLAFGTGHIFYISAMVRRFEGASGFLIYSLLISLAAAAAVFAVSVFLMKMRFGKFIIPAISYCILLMLFTALSAFILGSGGPAVKLLFTGSLFFLLSDLILSITYFSKEEDYGRKGITNPESRFMISINHITYYAAQFLIAVSVLYI